MDKLSDSLGPEGNPGEFGWACGSYRERLRRRALQMDHVTEFQPEDADDDAGAQFDYELGKDPARDALNCELFWCWDRFEREATERKWSQKARNFHVSSFAAHLRRQLGQATAEAGYINARRNVEGSRR